MRRTRPLWTRWLPPHAEVETGSRVVYDGPDLDAVPSGARGTVVSEIEGRMTQVGATPPTVPEDDEPVTVEVDFDGLGRRIVELEYLRPADERNR
jgi:hypothetical protein